MNPESEQECQVPEGPPIYANWVAANAGCPVLYSEEFPLFTDSHITGEVAYGPYEFLNAVPELQSGQAKPCVILRCSGHVEWPSPDMRKTSADRYHGGSFQEEIAALTSLAMGGRFRAGNSTRRFEPGGDPRGRPIVSGSRRMAPTLIRELHFRWRLPSAVEGEHSLDSLEILSRLPTLRPDLAVSLVRAARLYQDSLWLIESEPSLAWLMLVSAVETAANRWQTEKGDPLDRVRENRGPN